MKKILILLLLGINFIYANVGKITSIIGEVIIVRENKEIIASKGMILELNDRIKTKDNSKALLHLKDETTINIGKKSNLSIKEFVVDEINPTNSRANINFGNGLFRTITGKIGKLNPKRFKIKTKTGSIGIRGTIFDVVVTADITKVGVIEGGVYYINEKTKSQFEVKVGQKLIYDDQEQKIDIVEGNVEETDQIEIEETQENNASKEEDTQEEENQEESQEQKEESQEQNEEQEESNNDESSNDESTKQEENQDNENSQESQDTNEEENTNTNDSQENENSTENSDISNNEREDSDDLTNQNVEDDVSVENEANTSQNNQENKVVNNDEVKNLKNIETVNNSPILVIDENLTTRQNETLEIPFTGSDPDNDTIDYTIDSNTNNGELRIEENKLVYIPNTNYEGEDKFTITVTDAKGATTSVIVSIKIEVYNPTASAPTSTSDTTANLDTIDEVTKQIVGNDNYMEFGFLVNDQGIVNDVYSTGSLTPNVAIESYILDQTTASYSGIVAAIITDQNNNKTTVNDGQINLDFNFGSENFTGNVKINDAWNADINSGDIRSNQFNSSDITSNSSSEIQDITGDITGNFMGSNAQSVAGKINLNSVTNGSVKASFGASKGE